MDVGLGFDEFAPAGDSRENNNGRGEKKPSMSESRASAPSRIISQKSILPDSAHSEKNPVGAGLTSRGEQSGSQAPKEEGARPALELFEAVCSTCEEKITVPFRPDPSRKTFCKDCLRDYQRARAKAQLDQDSKSNYNIRKNTGMNSSAYAEVGNSQSAGLLSDDKTIRLSQIANIEPKKFKAPNKHLNINTQEIRTLINKSKYDGGA
jgi:CxxC-x17-CxxC domain-containing protein